MTAREMAGVTAAAFAGAGHIQYDTMCGPEEVL